MNTREPFPFWILALGAINAIGGLSINMYLPSFSNIASKLNTSAGMVQLTLASFFVGFSIGQLIYGPVSDRFGRKPLLQVGLAIFVLTSVGCMMAHDVKVLIALRFLQGLGACAGIVISRASVRDRLGPGASAKAYSIMMLVSGVAPVLAPLAGGLMLRVSGWEGIFAALAVGGLLCMVFVQVAVQESVDKRDSPPLRIGSVARSYYALLRDRGFVSYTLCGGFIHAGVFAYVAASPALLIDVFDVTPQFYSGVFGVNALGMVLVAQINTRLLNHFPLGLLLQRAALFMAVSLLLLAGLYHLFDVRLTCLLLIFFIYVAGFGICAPNGMALAMAGQKARAGTAAALLGAMHFSLSTVSCIVVSVWYDKTALPLLFVMGFCCIASLAILATMNRRCDPASCALQLRPTPDENAR